MTQPPTAGVWVWAPGLYDPNADTKLTAIQQQLGEFMSEVQDALDQVVTQLAKARDEILGKIADLEAQIAAGETLNLEPLRDAAQALDDVVPDSSSGGEEPPKS